MCTKGAGIVNKARAADPAKGYKFNQMAKAATKINDMHDYNVIFDYPASGDYLDDFTVSANSLKEAKQRAQFNKRIYCRYDKPASIPANRIRVIVKRIFNK